MQHIGIIRAILSAQGDLIRFSMLGRTEKIVRRCFARGGISAQADTMIVISHDYLTRNRLALGQPETARVGLLRQVRHYYHK